MAAPNRPASKRFFASQSRISCLAWAAAAFIAVGNGDERRRKAQPKSALAYVGLINRHDQQTVIATAQNINLDAEDAVDIFDGEYLAWGANCH